MGHDLVIRGGRVVTGDAVVEADIAVTDGRIAALGHGFDGAEVVEAAGLVVTPGGVDPHAHIEQRSAMGAQNADTFETATRSAAMGGTTTVISFAPQAVGQPLRTAATDYAARAARGAAIDHAMHLIVADPEAPDIYRDLRDLPFEGFYSFKIFMTYALALDDRAILSVLNAAAETGALVCVHAENDAMIEDAINRIEREPEDRTYPYLAHARSRPRAAEIEAVGRICRLAERTQARVMLFHISTAEAVAEIAAARARGAPVWAETCPHYLLMTEDVLRRPAPEAAKWVFSPPARTEADQAALWAGLAQGVLQLVSSDHAPYRMDSSGKFWNGPAAAFDRIANGMPGLETRMPLLFHEIFSRGRLHPSAFARLTAGNAAHIHGLRGKGRIAPGYDADLVLWDPGRRHTYGSDDLHCGTGYNPWEGRSVTGWPVATVLRGRVIMRNGEWLGRAGAGRAIDRSGAGATLEEITGSPAP